MVWIEFVICASLLTYFAYNLCKEGIIISEKTHIEEGVIGMFFLALATSFPEVATGATAVFSLGRIGLGYGDLVGSIAVNLMVLFALDYAQGKGRILFKVSRLNRLTGVFTLVVVLIVLSGAMLRLSGAPLPAFKGVGIESLIIPLIYFAYLNILRKKEPLKHIELYPPGDESFFKIWSKFAFFLISVMLLGIWMARTGEKIVVETGLSQGFTGSLLLGFATSLPEIIVSFSALRASSVDMAVGNILGSNLFDISVVPLLDVLSRRPILGMLTRSEVFVTLLALALSLITVYGLYAKRDSLRKISWDTLLIFVVGFSGFVLLYFVR